MTTTCEVRNPWKPDIISFRILEHSDQNHDNPCNLYNLLWNKARITEALNCQSFFILLT